MGQFINIPAMNGPIHVDVGVSYIANHDGKKRWKVENFANDADPFDASLKLPPPQGNMTAELKVEVMLQFPPKDENGKTVQKNAYTQFIDAFFPIVIEQDKFLFLDVEKPLQGQPLDPRAQQRSPFRFIEGKAWLSATQSPRHTAFKVKMVLGSPDVRVKSWETTEEEAVWTIGTPEKGSMQQGSIIDKIKKLIPKIEREEAKSSSTRGGSVTIGQLSQLTEWTMMLEMPEPKKPPKPMVFREGFMHAVYFDTNKTDIENYRHPRTKTDQLKDLIKFVDEQIARYGKDKITNVDVTGHSSRLGDTGPNITLAEGRANSVAAFLKRYFKQLKIPDENITFRGEPLDEGNDKDNSWKDRVVWVTINAVR